MRHWLLVSKFPPLASLQEFYMKNYFLRVWLVFVCLFFCNTWKDIAEVTKYESKITKYENKMTIQDKSAVVTR